MDSEAQQQAADAIAKDLEKAQANLMSQSAVELLIRIGFTALIVVVGYVIMKVALRLLKKTLEHSKMDAVLHAFFLNSARVVMWITILLTALNYMGIPPTAFLTVVGAAGVAVALALKDSLGNFAGGILIIITKPFSKGDFIEDLEISGKVQQIDLLYTTLTTFDNKIITVPNGKLANSTIVNYTRADRRRVDCQFTIGYEAEIAHAKDILLAIAESDDRIFREPEPVVGVAELGSSSVVMDFKVWCSTDDYWDVLYFIQEQVKLAFDEAGINIPYPQMDVHIRRTKK
ncbi:mechanosensitive ion channel family protein [Bacilliculturomica massiliensis]|uniref:mechanosensitive ion channel family protein n=1 Tax=Bacilliculturomica massiliensis TaxID=1917867 RepID=UPI001031F995|nr:mechanosensitive ion channel family protein [Bacilliculturomica massiliensis]